MNHQSRSLLATVLVSAATSMAVLALAAGSGVISVRGTNGAPAAARTPVPSGSSVVAAVGKANPAVVSIIVTKDVPVVERYYGSSPFDFFGDLFDMQAPQYRQKGTERREIGGGSGFFVSGDGLIVTNKHVVSDTKAEYTVYTNDGKKHAARVIALDPSIDLALIKVDAPAGAAFPSLAFGSSSELALGQSVIAIGNALGEFRNTVSVGVVSGLSRSIVAGDGAGSMEQLDEVIQTDAAINPGNSGGPLLDLSGNVIGVNVAVAAGSQSIGFALPADSIRGAVESVQRTGRIERPYIGVRYVEVTDAVKQQYKLTVDRGVMALGTKSEPAVIKGSPADKAGIRDRDVIVSFDGKPIDADNKLSAMVRARKVGDVVTLGVVREGREIRVPVKLEPYSAP